MSTPRPRREGETDESYNAMMVELGKFNERMYGKKKEPGQKAQPTQPLRRGGMDKDKGKPSPAPIKGPVKPVPPIKVITDPMRPTPVPPKEPAPPPTPTTRPPMPKEPGYSKGGLAKPIKKAAGGAAKVRKGMMSPEGKILHAMNKVRGK